MISQQLISNVEAAEIFL